MYKNSLNMRLVKRLIMINYTGKNDLPLTAVARKKTLIINAPLLAISCKFHVDPIVCLFFLFQLSFVFQLTTHSVSAHTENSRYFRVLIFQTKHNINGEINRF
jgi:hypothetical protein